MATTQDNLTYTEYCPGTAGELPSAYQFGSEGSVVTQVLDVTKPTDPASIARALLGWSSWDAGSKSITRHVPVACGAAPWLYAVGLNMHAVGTRSWNAAPAPTNKTRAAS